MRHNKHCSRSRGPGRVRRKGLCQTQEAIKVHSAAAGSARTQHSPPITLGGGGGGKGAGGEGGDSPHRPPSAPRRGRPELDPARVRGRRGSAQPPARPRRRSPSPPPLPAGGRPPRRPGPGSPARGSRPRGGRAGARRGAERPPGARQALATSTSHFVSTASSRRRRCRTSLAALPAWARVPPPPAPGPAPQTRLPACSRGRTPGGRGAGVGLRHPSRAFPEPSPAGPQLSHYFQRCGLPPAPARHSLPSPRCRRGSPRVPRRPPGHRPAL